MGREVVCPGSRSAADSPTASAPFLSSVDNGWLAAALMMIGNAKPAFSKQAEGLIRPMNFVHFYDPYDPDHPAKRP